MFQKVQGLVRPNGTDAPLMTIADFKTAHSIHGVADLFRAVVHKYKTPGTDELVRRALHRGIYPA